MPWMLLTGLVWLPDVYFSYGFFHLIPEAVGFFVIGRVLGHSGAKMAWAIAICVGSALMFFTGIYIMGLLTWHIFASMFVFSLILIAGYRLTRW